MLSSESGSSRGAEVVYNLRMPGQYADTETGLNYNAGRDYDPAIGRYIESDPIGLNGESYSTYGYVRGNPLSYNDPSGEVPLPDWVNTWIHRPPLSKEACDALRKSINKRLFVISCG